MAQRGAFEVVVAGGGVAAVELVLALHELAGPNAHVTQVAPNDELDIRALRTLASITGAPPPRLPLAPVAVRTHTHMERTTLRRVLPRERLAELGDSRRIPYDALVLAVGAQPTPAYSAGVVTFGTHAEGDDAVGRVLADLQDGRARSAAFVVPPGVAWTLPLYELALLTSQRIRGGADLTFVTPESAPLAIFGAEAAQATADLLAAAGIELRLDAYASIETAGHVELRPRQEVLQADRIVALPRPVGRAPEGVPSDAEGFVSVDDTGRVRETDGIFAIGDVTTFPVKQGGLACQLADVVAEHLAALAGVEIEPRSFRPVLRGQLLAGARTLHLDSPIAGGGGAGVAHARSIWRPSHKVDALHLSRLLEDEPGFGIPPVGVDVTVRLASPCELQRDPLALDPYSPLAHAGAGRTP